jgi:hypothetical protein
MRFTTEGRGVMDTVGTEEVLLTLNTDILGAIESAALHPDGPQLPVSRQMGKLKILVYASPAVTTVELRKP